MNAPKVYEAIRNVSRELQVGIIKEKPDNKKFGAPDYAFRGIDQVYNTLNPALVKNNLVILPKFTDRQMTERLSNNGKALFYVIVKGCFDFISTEDGSKHSIETIGEAMDSGDKATNKAMSIAYKYACFQAFCIPTEDASDPDNDVHEVEPNKQEKPMLIKGSKEWDRAVKVLSETGSLNSIKAHRAISNEDEKELISIVKTKNSDNDF